MGDQRVVRHIHTWRNAGVREDGPWRHQEEGRPKGVVPARGWRTCTSTTAVICGPPNGDADTPGETS